MLLEIGDVITDTLELEHGTTDTNAATIACTVRQPDGVVVDMTGGVRHPTPGHYEVDVPFTMGGTWVVRWVATGEVPAGTEMAYYVYPGETAKPLIVTPLEVASYTRRTLTEDDAAVIGMLIELLQDEAEMHASRELYVRTQAESRTLPKDTQAIFLYRTPVVSVESVTVDGALVDPAGYQVYPWGVQLSGFIPINYDWWLLGESTVVITYAGGKDGRTVPGLKMLLLRVVTREWLGGVRDVQGLKRLSIEGVREDYGDNGLEGFTEAEIAQLKSVRMPVIVV